MNTIGIAVLALAVPSALAGPFTVDYLDPPDFHQVRLGLDDNGSFHCGPTSAADGLQWLANNGWPALSPLTVSDDAADSQPTAADPVWVIQSWAEITSFIDDIAATMDTDVNDGTSVVNLMDGLEDLLGVYADTFYVGYYGRISDRRSNWERGGDFDTALDRLKLGDVVLANVGFYHDPTGYRCGGHWMCLMGYDNDPFIGRSVRLKDPARDRRSVSTHLVTTETVWLQEDGDTDGDGSGGGLIEVTVDSWNWARTIGSSNSSTNCPQGDDRHGYQDNVVYFGETLVRWAGPDIFTVNTWQLGRDLLGPLYDINVYDYSMWWDRNIIIYVERPTGLLHAYDLLTEAVEPISIGIALDDIRRVRVAPDGTMLVINIVNEDARMGTVVSPQGSVLGQFPLGNRLDAVWWAGTHEVAAGFLVADGASLLHVIPMEGANEIAQLPLGSGVLPKIAVDDRNHMLYATGAGAATVQRLDLKTMEFDQPLEVQAPVAGVATGAAGWLYVPLVQTGAAGSTFVFHNGQFQRVIEHGFSGNLSVDQPPYVEPADSGETTDWPFDFGDLDYDGSIGIGDLLVILDVWDSTTGGDADLDGDGIIAIGDVLALLSLWE
jgi:hypothetical protein